MAQPLHDPNDVAQHRTDAMCVGTMLVAAALGLFALQKLGFRAVIGVGR